MMGKKLYEESRGRDAAFFPLLYFETRSFFYVIEAGIELTVSPSLALTLHPSC